ncbi:hypothetical protein REPUB_Repub07fG0045300 [Reevesia pubescens]
MPLGGLSRHSTINFLFGSSMCSEVVISSARQAKEAYDPLDPTGNITIKWDVISWTPDGYVAVVTIYNFQKYRHIQAPGWTLGWTWAKKEIIWSMMGAQTTEQGDCSKYKGNIPHCCKKDPTVVDLLPGTPYNQQIANCCKGGVLNPWLQDPGNAASSFQVSVGIAGTTNKTVSVPRNFTLKAPGPGYTCGPAKIVKPTRFVTANKRRITQAMILSSGNTLLILITNISICSHAYLLHLYFCNKTILKLKMIDMECYVHIFTIPGLEDTYLLRLPLFLYLLRLPLFLPK